jgi:hypothetical protein
MEIRFTQMNSIRDFGHGFHGWEKAKKYDSTAKTPRRQGIKNSDFGDSVYLALLASWRCIFFGVQNALNRENIQMQKAPHPCPLPMSTWGEGKDVNEGIYAGGWIPEIGFGDTLAG